MELKLQKNYKGVLNATLQNTTTGEIEIKLSIAPISDLGFITIEPGVNGKEETIFYHRKLGTSVFTYGVNRDNPLQHIVGSSIILANSIDVFNLLLDKEQAPYVFKKSINDVIIKGGTFYINSKIFIINDLDTSVVIEDKVLEPNITNYVYIKNNDYFITQAYDDKLYPICDIEVDAGGVITNITKHKFSNILNASGYAPLDTLGKIPFQYLPAVFAAIEEYPTIGDFPEEGDAGILYVVIGESLSYRWDGDSYVAMTGIGDMFSGNNLSELPNKATARNNLNVYSQIQIDGMVSTLNSSINTKQNTLINQTNIKSVNGNSLLGAGNISLSDNRIDLVAGEAMSALQVYRRGTLLNSYNIQQLDKSVNDGIGYSTTSDYEKGQAINFTGILKDITLSLLKFGTGGNIIFNIEVFSNATFTTLLGTSNETITASILTTSQVDTKFTFNNINCSGPIYIKCNIVSGTINTTNYVGIGLSALNANAYPLDRYIISQAGVVTSNTNYDWYFKINEILEDTNKYYLALANNINKLKFEGISNNSVITDGTFSGSFDGIINVGDTTNYKKLDIINIDSIVITGTNLVSSSGLGQTFSFTTDKLLNTINTYKHSTGSGGTLCVYKLSLYKDGILITDSLNTQQANNNNGATFTFNFPQILLEANQTYEWRKSLISGNQTDFYYNTSNVYSGGSRTLNGVIQSGDVTCNINVFNTIPCIKGDNVYLQDNGYLDGVVGINTVLIGKVFSNTEIEFIKDKIVENGNIEYLSTGAASGGTYTSSSVLIKKSSICNWAYSHNLFTGGGVYASYTIQISSNNSTWYTLYNIYTNDSSGSGSRIFTIKGGFYYRLICVGTSGNSIYTNIQFTT